MDIDKLIRFSRGYWRRYSFGSLMDIGKLILSLDFIPTSLNKKNPADGGTI